MPGTKRMAAPMPVETPEAQQTQNQATLLMNFADELPAQSAGWEIALLVDSRREFSIPQKPRLKAAKRR